jgi:hypothetical protein
MNLRIEDPTAPLQIVAKPSRAEIKRAFRENLEAAMRVKGYSRSRLSKITGIGRSVIKTYTDESLALPNVFQLMRLAAALECDAHDLLPFLNLRNKNAHKRLAVDISKTLSLNTKSEEIFENAKNSDGKFLYYVPKSLPEGLKTEAIITSELGKYLDQEKIKYFQRLEELNKINANGCFLIKEGIILDLISRRGTYSNLSMQEVFEQIQRIRDYEEEKFPNLQIKVMIEATQLISDIFLIEDKVAYHEFFEQIITITDEAVLKNAAHIMNQQIKTSINFGEYIDGLKIN